MDPCPRWASLNPKGDRKAKLISPSHFITSPFKNNDKSFTFFVMGWRDHASGREALRTHECSA